MKVEHLMKRMSGSGIRPGILLIMKLTMIILFVAASNHSVFANMNNLEMQQTVQVRGTVTDARGVTLVGVNVVVLNTTLGTVTDLSGNYRIEVPGEQTVLQFSFIGYNTRTVIVGSQRVINVVLEEDTQDIEGVVVVGYSTKRQSELSSSVSVVSEEQLKGVVTNNLETMLQGKVPGLVVSNTRGRPGDGTTIVIRGVGSIGAGYDPLYVVDGIIGGSANPADIESITVLKDAAATGLYGSRAANGVIVITTKKGQAGKTRVNYNGSFGPSYHRDVNFDVMNSAQLFEYQSTGLRNYFDERVAAGDANFVGKDFNQYRESILPSSLLNIDTDWRDLLSRTGNVQRHQISVSGGDQKTTFYLSGNYYSELGTIINYDYQNIDFRANLQHKISDMFTLSARINANTNQRPNEPRWNGAYKQYDSNMPWDDPYEADGVTAYNPVQTGTRWIGNEKMNYFYDSQHYNDITKNMGYGTDLRLEAKFTEWMTFSTSNRIGLWGSDWTQLMDKYFIASYMDNGRLSQTYSYGNSYLTSNLFNLQHSFGEHNFAGILGQEYSYSQSQSTGAVGTDIVPGLSALSSAGKPNGVSGAKSETGFMSYFAQADYNYSSKYFLVGSVRRDASSRFGANNRWATFYSVGGSWIANKESFLKDVSWIDLLKFRLSYGTTGNANISAYLSLGTYSFSSAGTYDGNSGARPARLPNPDLTWEMAKTTNFGVEFAVFKRAKLEVDLYNRLNTQLLQAVPLSAASGFTSQQQNVGSMRNRGIDVNLTGMIVNREFKWEANVNVNINDNKVLSLNKGEDISSGSYMRIREGQPLRYFYMKEWAGVDPANGDPLWIRWEDANGNIIHGADNKTPANIKTTNLYAQASNLFIRSAYPDWVGGVRNDFSYKNFTMSILTNFAVGNWQYFNQRQSSDSDGAYTNYNQMLMNKNWSRWEKPGDIATHPKLVYGGNKQSNNVSSRYLEDASFLRLQNITIGYAFPERILMLQGLRMFVSMDNLLVFTKYSGADPDTNFENPVITADATSSRYSPTRKIIFGINFDI